MYLNAVFGRLRLDIQHTRPHGRAAAGAQGDKQSDDLGLPVMCVSKCLRLPMLMKPHNWCLAALQVGSNGEFTRHSAATSAAHTVQQHFQPQAPAAAGAAVLVQQQDQLAPEVLVGFGVSQPVMQQPWQRAGQRLWQQVPAELQQAGEHQQGTLHSGTSVAQQGRRHAQTEPPLLHPAAQQPPLGAELDREHAMVPTAAQAHVHSGFSAKRPTGSSSRSLDLGGLGLQQPAATPSSATTAHLHFLAARPCLLGGLQTVSTDTSDGIRTQQLAHAPQPISCAQPQDVAHQAGIASRQSIQSVMATPLMGPGAAAVQRQAAWGMQALAPWQDVQQLQYHCQRQAGGWWLVTGGWWLLT